MPSSAARLVVRDASGNVREVEISRTPFTLGRQSDNDLVLLDSRISRRHAQIIQSGNSYVIEDSGSRHGIFVNGKRVDSHPLKSGDQINLGLADIYALTFATEEAVLPGILERLSKTSGSRAPQIEHLGLLLQMAQRLNSAPALEEVLATLVDSAIQLADAERGLLFLREEGGELRLRLARGKGEANLSLELVDYSHAIVQRVADTGREEVILEEPITGRTAQETAVIQVGQRGVVALPLQKLPLMEMTGETIHQTAPELLGVLYLESSTSAASLTGLDRQVLRTLAVEGATVIENARMFRLTRERERTQHDLALARKIQEGLLPSHLPQSDYFVLEAATVPCQTVGGDYYDVIALPRERFGFAVADVSGKGVPAAMLAASLQGAFVAVATGDPDLSELFRRVNEFLCERTPPDMFATIFYGVLDRSGQFRYVNAGHVPPLVLRANGAIARLDSSSFPVGFFPEATFPVETAQLEPGDLLLICSDGVTEAHDTSGELLGDGRLKEILVACAGHGAHQVWKEVVSAVQRFVGSAPQSDDITLAVMRFAPQ